MLELLSKFMGKNKKKTNQRSLQIFIDPNPKDGCGIIGCNGNGNIDKNKLRHMQIKYCPIARCLGFNI